MGVKPVIFQSGGQSSSHLRPGAYSRFDVVPSGGGAVNTNIGIILGDSRGGEPGRVLAFSSPAEARATLRSGPLLDTILAAFNPGGGAIPQSIRGWRVNPGTKASRVLKTSAADIIRVDAWDWGLHGNQVQVKQEAGTNPNTKKLSVVFQTQTPVVVDNVGRQSFSIQYTGAGSAALMTITGAALTTSITGAAPDNLNVDLASFPTIEALVNFIDNHASYSCSMITGDSQQLTAQLDAVTAQSIMAAATVYSTLQAIIEAFRGMPWIGGATFVGAARTLPDNDAGWVYMSGGTDGAYTQTEWVAALSSLESEDVQFIGASTATESIHLLIKGHVERMNGVEGKGERQFLLGGALGETVDAVLLRAQHLASDTAGGALLYPGIKTVDVNGAPVTLSPVFYAAMELGRQTTLALNEPATNKDVGVLDWEVTVSPSDQDRLIAGGVWVGIKTRNGRFTNCRSVTTSASSDLQKCEFSIMREMLFANRDLRESIELSFTGRPGTKGRYGDIDVVFTSRTLVYLNDLQIFLNKPRNYVKRIQGDQVIIDYDADVVSPINFSFITAHFSVAATAPV